MSNSDSDMMQRPIVILEHDADDADLLRLLWRKAGVEHPLQFFPTAEEMIAAMSRLLLAPVALLPLLCVLEWGGVDAPGVDVLRWFRSQPAFDVSSVVALSSSDDREDIRRAAAGGAQCYLTKYPQPAVLRRVVQEARLLVWEPQPAKHWFGLSANQFLRWNGEKTARKIV